MGHGAKGREYFLRHIVYSRLSSFEIGIWAGIKDTLISMPRRSKEALALYTPFLVAGYLLNDWMNAENEKSHRKIAKDFENDV